MKVGFEQCVYRREVPFKLYGWEAGLNHKKESDVSVDENQLWGGGDIRTLTIGWVQIIVGEQWSSKTQLYEPPQKNYFRIEKPLFSI